MLEFKEITLADKPWMQELLRRSDYNSVEYNFSFTYIWRGIYNFSAARMNDFLIIRSAPKNRPPTYLFPAGSGDVAPVLEALEQEAYKNGAPLVFHTVLAEQVKLLQVLYPGRFEFMAMTDYFDYVYDAESLRTLAGKKLHSKRNHIHRFCESYPNWRFEPITPENLPEVIRMNERWCEQNGCMEDRTLRQEACSVRAALHSYFSLQVDGGLLRTEPGGEVIAFSIGDRLNSNTYLVHIEKAFGEIQGAYAMINQQFAKHYTEGYLYINREDDSGNEGLRRAKRSYRPVFLVEKYAAKLL